jgi:hypothetical protein
MGGTGFWSFVGQAIVVGLGWFVVHRLSVKRDMDKARRELVADSADALVESLNSLLADALKYHRAERDQANELHLKMALQDLAVRAAGLSDICRDERLLTPCRTEIAGARKAITGKHFEDEHDGPLSEADPHLQTVAEAVLRAKRSLLKIRYAQFPPS